MLRVALVHDWLTGMRGGEKCLDRLCSIFPDATLATLFHAPGRLNTNIENRDIRTSCLQHLPGWRHYYRYLLPLFPFAANWRFEECDVVLSLSHCAAKAAAPPPGVPHICYCFTPMRYAWHMQDQYFRAQKSPLGWLRNQLLKRMRNWDRMTSDRVTHFVAISQTVRRRIHECYGRDSTVIYPPVDVDYYTPIPIQREDYYLLVSAFAPYKRIDLAVAACAKLQRRLVIIGDGQVARRLRAMSGPHVQFLGWQPDHLIREHYRRCRALLFPGEEDFGIVPLEAQACGAPVIAFGRGGATETVRPNTGLLFKNQTVDALATAILDFEKNQGSLDADAARKWAESFSNQRFDREITDFITNVVQGVSTLRQAA